MLGLLIIISFTHAYVVKIGLTAEKIGRAQWDQVTSTSTSPFCEFDWIFALEKSKYSHVYPSTLYLN